MELFLQLSVVTEITLINYLSFHYFSTPKYSLKKTVGILLLFTVGLIAAGLAAMSLLPFYGNGNGLFVFIGFLYLIPINYLYQESPLHNCIVLCSVWLYTLTIFSISVQTAYMLDCFPFTLTALVCQTLLFLLTCRPYISFLKKTFLYILKNVEKTTYRRLIQINFLSFILVFFMHISFIFPDNHFLRITAMLLLFFHVICSYLLLQNIIERTHALAHMETIACTDSLTGLQNRKTFQEDAKKRIEQQLPFHLIFIDLNHFKQINDTYGHLAGDCYLKDFSAFACSRLSEDGILYRLAGDEFICIMDGGCPEAFTQSISPPLPEGRITAVPFLGASTGCVHFPSDALTLEHLISAADYKMYRNKQMAASDKEKPPVS